MINNKSGDVTVIKKILVVITIKPIKKLSQNQSLHHLLITCIIHC